MTDEYENTGTISGEYNPSEGVGILHEEGALIVPMAGFVRNARLVTKDLAGIALTKTWVNLYWHDYDLIAQSDLQHWAANPSPIGTRWFLLMPPKLVPPYAIDASHVYTKGVANYVNADFGSKTINTYVKHVIEITGCIDGTAKCKAKAIPTGEFWWLLKSNLL